VLFNSLEFIFVFLPATLAGYLVIGKVIAAPAARMLWLALASLAFYGYCNVNFLPVIGISIVVNFLFALAITGLPKYSKARRSGGGQPRSAEILQIHQFRH
jgi:alginate O-acetyltransferase complex protein AlgI